MEYKTATIQEIAKDANEKGKEALEFLSSLVNETFVNKKGNEQKVSFITVKKKYFEKYYPENLPKAKPKKPSMIDVVNQYLK